MAVGDTHNLLRDTEDRISHVFTGTAAPATAPVKIGDMFLDTTNKLVYIALGTTDSGDWELVNGP